MGIRGLSTYIHEHLHEVLVRHKLHQRKVVIDGNNLAHILYFECTGINAAFGGDYDKYASFIEEFFKGLQVCEIYPIVIMDGGQPLDNKKMNTVRERVTNQIQTCLNISPSSQYRLKVFPCMGRDVFVSTLKKMGIVVLQTDFEADLEIAMLAKELGLTVLSNDSDFYMFSVPFVPLSSITYNKVSTGKKKSSNKMFSYINCNLFNQEKFCQVTGIDPAHLPILATLLGNDYLAFDHFKDFYNILEDKNKRSRMTSRHNTIKNVLTWLSHQKAKTTEEILSIIVSYCSTKNLRSKMRATMKNYIDTDSNLINLVSENTLNHALDNTGKPYDFSIENFEIKHCIFQNPSLSAMNNVTTSLFCKNGKKLPSWFVLAYRAHRIPHEIADIVTQEYFISPPQVEEKSFDSAYLFIEPIVKAVYTMLWKSSQTSNWDQNHSSCNSVALNESSMSQSCGLEDAWTASKNYDSDDVVVEEDSEESLYDKDEGSNEESQLLNKKEINEIVVNNEEMQEKCNNSEMIGENVRVINEVVDDCALEVKNDKPKKGCLKWYLRKGSRMWIKRISQLSYENAKALPSLNEVELLSVFEKRKVFYSILKSNLQSSSLELPDDLELIFGFIIFWYEESMSSLIDIHVLSVLVCVFMFYIIDNKVGRKRTRKSFEDKEKWEAQFAILKDDASYCQPGDNIKDTLAQVSEEECLLAGYRLFKFHHMDQKINDKYYNKKTVHAFSEYQACIYFVQLLNTLLGSPFPLLSIEYLWGGTFCYNVFYDLKKRKCPLNRVSELFGKGSCLEKLFLIFFRQLNKILNFKKYLGIIDLESVKAFEKEKPDRSIAVLVNNNTENIQKKKKKRRKSNKKSACNDKGIESEKKEVTQKEEELLYPLAGPEEREEEVDLLDNRFASLIL
ncbi:protein asteroid-like isoform X2 [Portunus trituberculatus]|nr:protein asteroid-like isoform X2 [Portunus trituberculatus]XP_045111012.1 protein asteroid-like isoform X2 [Portunus trituberculatus]